MNAYGIFLNCGIFIWLSLKRVADEGSVPEIAQYGPCYLPLNVFTASKG